MENFEFLAGMALLVLGMLIWASGKRKPDPANHGKPWEKALSPLRLQAGHEVLKWFVGMFFFLAGLFIIL